MKGKKSDFCNFLFKILRSNWDDYYPSENGKHTTRNKILRDPNILSFKEGNQYVLEVKFENLTNHAISFDSVDKESKLLIESCYFIIVSSMNENGGATYYRTNGSACFSSIYGTFCHCGECFGHFLYTEVTDAENFKNYMNYSSLSACGAKNMGNYNCRFTFGKAEMTQSNISQCKGRWAGFVLTRLNSESAVEYSTFENDTSSSSYVFSFNRCENDQRAAHCIFSGSSGTYLLMSQQQTNLIVNEYSFVHNNASFLFFAYNATMTLYNCLIDNNDIGSKTSVGVHSYSFNIEQMKTSELNLSFSLLNVSSFESIKFYISQEPVHDYSPCYAAGYSLVSLKN